jgi:GNAT superfamily N-acetyltransferase
MIGRLRRFYVARNYRRTGIGSSLLQQIFRDAKNHFQVVVLNTDTLQADQFYCSHGFFKRKSIQKIDSFLKMVEIFS